MKRNASKKNNNEKLKTWKNQEIKEIKNHFFFKFAFQQKWGKRPPRDTAWDEKQTLDPKGRTLYFHVLL